MKGDIQRGGERYVLLEEQVLSGQLGLQDLLEGGEGHICSVNARVVVPPLEKKVWKSPGLSGETLMCRTQQMMGSVGSERLFTTEGAGPASSSSA